ncbi:MAG: hypothetical protein MZW92_63715 [Comamonadaceae bacterium]|nr:hypothetical protein [Comamonadaceae bacterium]
MDLVSAGSTKRNPSFMLAIYVARRLMDARLQTAQAGVSDIRGRSNQPWLIAEPSRGRSLEDSP